MMRLARLAPLALLFAAPFACGTTSDSAVAPDGGSPVDAGADSSAVDAAHETKDAAEEHSTIDAHEPDGATADCSNPTTYDDAVLCDQPVAYWAMNQTTSEPDLTGNGNAGTYKGGKPTQSTLPNGDAVAVFNGSSEYLKIGRAHV